MAASSSSKKNVTSSADDKPADVSSPDPTPATPTDTTVEPAPAPTLHAADETKQAEEAQDIEALLSRHTFDGKGDNAVPPSDFRGYATDNVEKAPLKSVEEVAQEVLNGSWGPNAQVVTERLHAAGYNNLDEIEAEYNRRVQKGAPKAF